MHFNGFYIDLETSDEDYLFIDVDGFTVIVKRECEGIVVDIYPLHVADDPIASTYAFHSELTQEPCKEITTMTHTATKTYLVGVIERAIAYYEVEAEDARTAAENWEDGEFQDRDDEALASEGPCNVRERQPDGTFRKLRRPVPRLRPCRVPGASRHRAGLARSGGHPPPRVRLLRTGAGNPQSQRPVIASARLISTPRAGISFPDPTARMNLNAVSLPCS
jgi:hypothetical protein